MNILDRIIAMGKFIINKFWWIGLIIIIYIFVIGPIMENKRRQKYENDSYCATVAYTIGRTKGRISEYKYIYYVNGKKYQGQDLSGFNLVNTIDGKYLLKYMCDNPQDALIYFNKPIEGDTIPAEYLNE